MAPRLVDVSDIETNLENYIKSWTGRRMSVLAYSDLLKMLQEAPTVNAVVPVRCEQCKLWGPRLEDPKTGLCWLDASEDVKVRREDEYCSRGVLRQEGEPEPASPVNT